MTIPKYHLVVVGFDEIVINKYLPCIQQAISDGYVDSYSVIDLEPERETIDKRIGKQALKPEHIYYLPDPRQRTSWADFNDFIPVLEMLRAEKRQIRIYIATEVKAHEPYLRYCIENQIDSLVEKPVIAPFTDGRFDPARIEVAMQALLKAETAAPAMHSVMTLSRYHQIYNSKVLNGLRMRMLALEAPLSSFHIRAAGGVWNLHREYEVREDHPYRYGYGMLMHGAYHYVDLAAQFLSLNRLLFPDDELSLEISSYAAYPADQNGRISRKYARLFDDDLPNWWRQGNNSTLFGETDITSAFCMRNERSGRTVTIGTLSFEQTTPSVRYWKDIPPDLYNKNGRTSNVDLEAQLSTLHSISVQCFDVPLGRGMMDKVDAFARVSTRTNASLLRDDKEQFNTEETFSGLFHSDSNRKLMSMWLAGCENKSRLAHHLMPMRLTQALAESIQTPGRPVTIALI